MKLPPFPVPLVKGRHLLALPEFEVNMAGKESTNHEILQGVSDKIIESLSADPLQVANSLFAKKMIPKGVLEAML